MAWLGDSLIRLRAASADVRSDVGYQLRQVQRGDAPGDLHCFVKKSRKTPKADIDLGKQRYAALLESRRKRK